MTTAEKIAECFKIIERRQLAALRIDKYTRASLYRHYDRAAIELHDIEIVARRAFPELMDGRSAGRCFKPSAGHDLVDAGVLEWIYSGEFGRKVRIVEERDNGTREHVTTI